MAWVGKGLRESARRAAAGIGSASLAFLLLAGCATDREARIEPVPTIMTPLPPVFLNSPMALFLTNSQAYGAQVAATEFVAGKDERIDGDLLVSGSRILFAPYPAKDGENRYAKAGQFSFLWLADEKRGYVLSEALQGYAPVSLGPGVTNLAVTGTGMGETIDGHPCREERATAQLSDGATAVYRVWRATDLNLVSCRVETASAAATNRPPATLRLSRVRPQVAPAELFVPPSGFTKYPSAEAMADELAFRQRNLKRKSWESY